MKAGTAGSIIVIYPHNFKSQLSGRCTLEIVSDEETGGCWGTCYHLVDDGSEDLRADCGLIGEPSGLDSIRFGERGTFRTTFTVTAQAAHGDSTHRSEGAIRLASRLINELVSLEHLDDLGMNEKIKQHISSQMSAKSRTRSCGPGLHMLCFCRQ